VLGESGQDLGVGIDDRAGEEGVDDDDLTVAEGEDVEGEALVGLGLRRPGVEAERLLLERTSCMTRQLTGESPRSTSNRRSSG
jgi:hypothetical protein